MSTQYIFEYGFNFIIKPFEISLNDIIEKVRCYSACCPGQVLVKDHWESEDSNDKEHQGYSGKDFDIID